MTMKVQNIMEIVVCMRKYAVCGGCMMNGSEKSIIFWFSVVVDVLELSGCLRARITRLICK